MEATTWGVGCGGGNCKSNGNLKNETETGFVGRGDPFLYPLLTTSQVRLRRRSQKPPVKHLQRGQTPKKRNNELPPKY